MEASYLEIYNESLRDLLANPSRASKDNNNETKYEIKHDNKGNTSVTHLTQGIYSFIIII